MTIIVVSCRPHPPRVYWGRQRRNDHDIVIIMASLSSPLHHVVFITILALTPRPPSRRVAVRASVDKLLMEFVGVSGVTM